MSSSTLLTSCTSRISGTVKLVALNVRGLISKLNMSSFLDFISNYDIVCLVETWITNAEDFTLPGFKCFGLEAVKVHSKGRGANGIIIGVRL